MKKAICFISLLFIGLISIAQADQKKAHAKMHRKENKDNSTMHEKSIPKKTKAKKSEYNGEKEGTLPPGKDSPPPYNGEHGGTLPKSGG